MSGFPDRSRFREMHWGASTLEARGPIISSDGNGWSRTALGDFSGPYGTYRRLGLATGALPPDHIPNYEFTTPQRPIIVPNDAWFDSRKIITLDPWGHLAAEVFAPEIAQGADIRPTIAMTPTRMGMPEIFDAMREGSLTIDNKILFEDGADVWKIAIDPVWHLPGLARRFNIDEGALRKNLFGDNVTYSARDDIKLYLPPISGTSVYFFADPYYLAHPEELGRKLQNKDIAVTARVHDECNGSDVFSTTICTCRPFLAVAANECIKAAQDGGVGILAYFGKEGRNLGQVLKYGVYNARARQPGGDRPDMYFARTIAVAGTADLRFQTLMPDVFHWLGVRRIDKFLSMSPEKYNAIIQAGIEIVESVELPQRYIPAGASTEWLAKTGAGYKGRVMQCTGGD